MKCEETEPTEDVIKPLPSRSQLFEYRAVEKKKLMWSFTITVSFMIVEIVGGLLVNSVALLSDAFHMFTHCFAIGIGIIAIRIARNPPCHHKTYGMYRAEVLAAFVNGLFLLLIVGTIVYESILRIINPSTIESFYMFLVALSGLGANIASIIILRNSHKSINVKSVFLHMIADAASSVGIVFAAIIIYYTNWVILDPLVAIAISVLILFWAKDVLKESSRILLEIAPAHLNIDIVGDALKKEFPDISEIFHMHLWTITPEILVLSANIKVKPHVGSTDACSSLVSKIHDFLLKKYSIIETTIQIMEPNAPQACNINGF